jgi:FtsH-binding integral membrane protein
MENRIPDYSNVIQIEDADQSRKFIAKVFAWMFVALGLSAAFAYAFSNTPSLLALVFDITPTGIHATGLGFLSMIAPLVFVLIMRFGMNRISYGVLTILFIAYAAVTGISLTVILLAFTASSVLGVFLTTSVVFGVMAIAGYTTNTDLTKFGSILMMLLVGIIVATILNYLLLHSSGLDMLINYIGVAIFVGLTAYHVQKLKRIGAGIEYGDASAKKLALMGGLTLYLDFINLFIRLILIFGRRR